MPKDSKAFFRRGPRRISKAMKAVRLSTVENFIDGGESNRTIASSQGFRWNLTLSIGTCELGVLLLTAYVSVSSATSTFSFLLRRSYNTCSVVADDMLRIRNVLSSFSANENGLQPTSVRRA
jgi:hypothetical protein